MESACLPPCAWFVAAESSSTCQEARPSSKPPLTARSICETTTDGVGKTVGVLVADDCGVDVPVGAAVPTVVDGAGAAAVVVAEGISAGGCEGSVGATAADGVFVGSGVDVA